MFFIKLKTDNVGPDVGKVGEAIDQAHHEEDRGADPDGHAGIALFNLGEGGPADGSALCREGHGNPPAPPQARRDTAATSVPPGV